MAEAEKTRTPAERDAADQAKVEEAVTPAPRELVARDRATAAARKAEEDRQAAIVAAVDKANTAELPKLGGPLRSPGLGR